MKGFKKNLLLGIIIIAASISGYFLKAREMRNYVVETETDADDIYTTRTPEIDVNEYSPPRQDGKININTASAEQLCGLDGIGTAKAERIIKFREKHGNFEVTEDIMKVDGIGIKTYEKIKDDIVAE